ncbi:MAG: hypothetical protein GF416_09520 [Candidatus Altiarchaeales archaeon]|nr:hypothetical protein [Candidatus Altiarchaeales archaeon]MBD3417358.1 hypothetical protein [Candidatus Altiarchaeales archaeon]
MDFGLGFIIGLCAVSVLGAYIYSRWYAHFYKLPHLSRTEISLQIDEKVVYLPHVSSVREEFVFSMFLMLVTALLGFIVYLLAFYLLDMYLDGIMANMALAMLLTGLGGALGFALSLSKKTVIYESSGSHHTLHLKDIDTVQFRQELTRDIWDYYKQIHKVK